MNEHVYTAALKFALEHIVRHGDAVSAPAAQRHLDAMAAKESSPSTPLKLAANTGMIPAESSGPLPPANAPRIK